jgi:PII-like signaling protein
MGYGLDSKIHTAKILRLSEDLPIVIEIVDEPQKIEKILPFLNENIKDGLVTLEKVHVIRYQHQN